MKDVLVYSRHCFVVIRVLDVNCCFVSVTHYFNSIVRWHRQITHVPAEEEMAGNPFLRHPGLMSADLRENAIKKSPLIASSKVFIQPDLQEVWQIRVQDQRAKLFVVYSVEGAL